MNRLAGPVARRQDLRMARMRDGDVAAVIAVEHAAYDFPWNERVFKDCLRVGYSCWVAQAAHGSDRDLCGFAVMSIGAGEAHVLNLCVAPQWHRHGIGARLLTHLQVVARNHRVERMLLEVRPSNLAAVALYIGAGFVRIGERKGYYPAADGREDALVLALDLAFAGANETDVSAPSTARLGD